MQILGLLGMYFDAVVVEVKTFLLLFRLALAILWSDQILDLFQNNGENFSSKLQINKNMYLFLGTISGLTSHDCTWGRRLSSSCLSKGRSTPEKIVFFFTFFFLNDLFLYLAIDTVFHPSGIIQNGRVNFFKITCLES